ncbi:MAG: response regulator transcription factor [Dehalococcoidales bacterium]|nr:response regulator transcription factor [Dehalococcoidales bacterium]
MNRVGVFISVDCTLVREGLLRIIAQDPDFAVVADGIDLAGIAKIGRHTVRLLVLGCLLGSDHRLEALRTLPQEAPETRAIVIANADDSPALIQTMTALNMAAYVPLAANSRDILLLLHAAARGHTILHSHASAAGKTSPPLPTSREVEVLRLVAVGCTNREIARRLCVTSRTVGFHVSSLLAKAGVASRMQLVISARKMGWFDL